MTSMERGLADAIHEVADLIVNWDGYADDAEESNRRSALRAQLEVTINETVCNFRAANL